jgi:hypothetical protein
MKPVDWAIGWAIDLNSSEGHGLMGYGYFGWERPEHCSAYKTAVFSTREKARKALREYKAREWIAFPHARIVKVRVGVIPE